jgi:hypothetical protein
MKMEDIVREQHALEDRIADFRRQIDEFLRLAFRELDVRKHELAMAKLVDRMSEAASEATRIDDLFKGLLLKQTYQRRKAGEKPSFFSTFIIDQNYDVDRFVKWQFRYPIPLTEELAQDWAAGNAESTRKLLQSKIN